MLGSEYMKKLRLTFISVISLILILLGSVSVSAKNNEYYLKELGMTIEISDTLSVKTRESSDLPKGTYLEAANDDKSMTLVIEMDKNENSKEVDSFANQSSAYLEKYKANLENFIGPVKVMTCGRTKQVNDYDRYNWTMFDSEAVTKRHEAVWPVEKAKAFALGAKMVSGSWE